VTVSASRRRKDEMARDIGAPLGTAVLGAGPAGLTAGYILAQRGEAGTVLEASERVGGLATTVHFGGYRFDLGGHRFFTKLGPIADLWEEMLGDDFLTRPRLSRIYHRGQFMAYPLKGGDVIRRLGVVESARCALSYLWSRRRRSTPETFEDWVAFRFGRRLYDTFFRSYTEKVWGIPGSEIRAEWAAQRIKNFSLLTAVLTMMKLRRTEVTTLIEEFRYPRLGPGQMWEAFRERVEGGGVPVMFNRRCVAVRHAEGRVQSIVLRSEDGREVEHPVEGVISSIPLNELVLSMRPAPPEEVVSAARRLRYRNMCLVALTISREMPFPDNWIYLHDPEVRAGRVQNFGAWSPAMVVPGTTCLGVEYFCFRDDDIWTMSDDDAVALATRELVGIGLIDASEVIGGVKVRVPNAYPMYDAGYREALAVVRGYVAGLANLQTCGRNGLHRYNNQDHSMWTAVLATLNLLDGASHDLWAVNAEDAYHEEGAVEYALVGSGALGGAPQDERAGATAIPSPSTATTA
jgi:protoporphyrinogen oxidase